MKRFIFGMALAVGLSAGIANAQTEVNVLSINRDSGPWQQLYKDVVEQFNKDNPDIRVKLEYMEDEAFKQKLPTLLQTEAAPHLFYSWGGGVFYEQAKQGFLRDISGLLDPAWKAEASQAGMDSLSYEGKNYGAPEGAQYVVFWYNKDLAKKVGVDPTQIKSWDDFLEQVKKAKEAGVTPIIAGGLDKWPLHFYYSYLAMRIIGEEGMKATSAGEDGGFNNEGWIKAGQEFKRLIDLQPFQEGFMGAKYEQASGLWGDGGALFHLMGSWDNQTQAAASSTGKGLSAEQLGVIPFPMVEGGKGDPTAMLGGSAGFIVGKNAPDETVKFLQYFMGSVAQSRAAEEGLYIPSWPAAGPLVKNPMLKDIAAIGSKGTYLQLFLDQFFGATLGGAINDASAQLATGDTTPEEVAESLESTRQLQ